MLLAAGHVEHLDRAVGGAGGKVAAVVVQLRVVDGVGMAGVERATGRAGCHLARFAVRAAPPEARLQRTASCAGARKRMARGGAARRAADGFLNTCAPSGAPHGFCSVMPGRQGCGPNPNLA
eukprot:366088-Chlamydomonas_euryale.AAC.22